MTTVLDNNYVTHQGYECLNACLVNYLRFFGFDIRGSDVFFIGDGSGFIFSRNEEEDRRIVATRQYEANYEFCNKVGLDYSLDSVRNEDPLAVLEYILENKGCVILHASSLFLTYNPVFRNREAFHFLNVLKIDREKSRMYISDGYIPALKPGIYEGWAPMNDILEGWKRADNRIFSVNSMPQDYFYKSEIEKAYDIMIRSLKGYIYNHGGVLSDSRKICFYVDSVLNKIKDKSKYINEMSDLHFNLKVNGFFAYKHFILEQMEKEHMEVWEEYSAIVKKWDAWYMNLNKLRVIFNAMKNERAYERFLSLTENEEKFFHKIITESGGGYGGCF